MKKSLQLIIVLLSIILHPTRSFSQCEDCTVIRISRISYISNHFGAVKKQFEIDLKNNKLYRRKKVNRKFKEIKTTQDLSLLGDSLKLDRIKQISKSITKNKEECLYHNEYGYYRIELLKFSGKDQIYGESFLINNPYGCQNENDVDLVRAYFRLIQSLYNEN